MIDVDEDETTSYSFYGKQRFGSGLSVLLHEWYENIQIGLAVGVPTGSTSYVGVQKQVRIMHNIPPWSDCVSVDKEHSTKPYSRKNCLQSCSLMDTMAICGCHLWYQGGSRSSQCGVAQTAACIYYLENCKFHFYSVSICDAIFKPFQVAPSGTNDECVADCPKDCEETMYHYIPSYVSIVSQNTVNRLYQVMDSVDHLYTDDDLDNEGKPPQWNASILTEKFFMDNIVAMEIGYSHFNVDTFESTPDLTFTSFVSKIGGLMGLVAGISFMTVYEFLEYPFVKLMLYFSKTTEI